MDFTASEVLYPATILRLTTAEFCSQLPWNALRRLLLTLHGSFMLKEGFVLLPDWVFTAKVKNESLAGDKITITAYDMPGNETVEEKTLA